MARLFGTDGVRGLANRDITADLALQLSVAAAHVLGEQSRSGGRRLKAVVGRDGRASGEFLSAAVCAGLASAGVDVFDAGVLPTPAIAFLTAEIGADFGVMLSASHNAMPDNGIKFFASGGHKLDDAVEDAIEARLAEEWERPIGSDVGRIRPLKDGHDRYVAHLMSVIPHRLEGLKIVIDAAHGAAARVSPQAFRTAGADVVVIGAEPDGLNINDGYGSTHLGMLQAAVVEHGADLGIAHDGDADRCLAVDHTGAPVDGDQIMSILAIAMRERGVLKQNTLVATVMSNLGMFQALEREGITVRKTAVGDRYVLEDMKAGGYSLGGEQSGHVIVLDHGTTGDGTLTGLLVASRVAQTGRTLKQLAAVMNRLPQSLINVKGVDKNGVEGNAALQGAVQDAERELGTTGRVLLRKSGTEPLVRVMVEAESQDQAYAIAQRLADVVKTELSL
ncbi:phosphoglucosamine mutase [Arsenicicoccus piscis]|uniref:Phosphoglucosamine mutase n=1 Tax=Arsenicicoccus piscis TaxID=673954 RepID=A0ABQ6HIG5_9MICO|nr:phosphoglucosamine mutase [Arsenicicoccus piscis]MCH8627834.1 phosphoglucosamine mutase [Arsenicicoccus piscis]GMA18354.1 phosphoglucosamine mutase [Arsenicicoccus piscis]